MNPNTIPLVRTPSKASDADHQTEAVTRIGNYNILRVGFGTDGAELQEMAAAQSKLDTSPQEQLAWLHKKAQALLDAIERHESAQKKKNLISLEATEQRKTKLRAFLKNLEAFAAEKGVAVKDQVQVKVGQKIEPVRVSAQSLALRNKKVTQDPPANPTEVFLKKGLSAESRLLVAKKLAVVLKRLTELEQTVGDPTVFAEKDVAATIRDELASLKTLEKGTLLAVIDKLDFIQKDFARFQPEFKKQFLQQDQKKEMLAQMEEFIREFQEERIEDIPTRILEAVETVEANSNTLTSLAKTVDDFKAVNGLSKAIGKEAESNREVLSTLQETLAENIRQLEQNRAAAKAHK